MGAGSTSPATTPTAGTSSARRWMPRTGSQRPRRPRRLGTARGSGSSPRRRRTRAPGRTGRTPPGSRSRPASGFPPYSARREAVSTASPRPAPMPSSATPTASWERTTPAIDGRRGRSITISPASAIPSWAYLPRAPGTASAPRRPRRPSTACDGRMTSPWRSRSCGRAFVAPLPSPRAPTWPTDGAPCSMHRRAPG